MTYYSLALKNYKNKQKCIIFIRDLILLQHMEHRPQPNIFILCVLHSAAQ